MNVSGIGWTTATIVWMGFLFYILSLSGREMDEQFDVKRVSLVGHIALLSGLAALLQLAIRRWHFEVNLNWVTAGSLFSSLFGISDEYHQHLLTDGMLLLPTP